MSNISKRFLCYYYYNNHIMVIILTIAITNFLLALFHIIFIISITITKLLIYSSSFSFFSYATRFKELRK